MKLPEKNKAAQLFDQFCTGYKQRDLNFLLSLFTEDCNLWGTGADEYFIGLEGVTTQLQRDWRQSEQGEIEVVSYVPAASDAPWAAAISKAHITINGKRYTFEDLRGTIFVKKEMGSFKIAHMHASFPDYRNAQGGSFPSS